MPRPWTLANGAESAAQAKPAAPGGLGEPQVRLLLPGRTVSQRRGVHCASVSARDRCPAARGNGGAGGRVL